MAIYSKVLNDEGNSEWKKAFEEYEAICGFEPMFQDDIDSGDIKIHEAWLQNLSWLEDVVASVTNIPYPDEYLNED